MKAKALRNYKQKSAAALAEFAQHVHDSLVATGSFPTTVMTAADFQSDIDDFNTAVAKAIDGSKADTAGKITVRNALIADLDAFADWCDANSGGDPSVILTDGFEPTATSHASSLLAVPNLNSATSYANTKLKLIIEKVDNARGYEAQVSIGTGPWVLQASFTSTRNTILENLVPGTLYNIRIRAKGGSTGYSEWSGVVTCMCT